jgi:t-SNARE domain-containing protein 1
MRKKKKKSALVIHRNLFNFSSQIQQTTNERIQLANKDLHRLTSIVKKSGDKQQKLQVEKLVYDWKTIAEKYIQCQKSLAVKIKKNYMASVEDSYTNNENISEMENQQQRLLMEREVKFSRDLLHEREQNFLKIESEISDINQLMKELSSITTEQGEMVDTIENSVEQSVQNVESGASELEKARNYQAKYKRKLLILFLIALVVTIIVLILIFKK